jgi:signal transduction histidine kinase
MALTDSEASEQGLVRKLLGSRRIRPLAIAERGDRISGLGWPMVATLTVCASLFSGIIQALDAHGAMFSIALFATLGATMGPFAGGNESEWARHLERVLRIERDRLVGMLNAMDEGVALVGLDRKIRFMNPSMVRQFGDGTGLHCYEHLHHFDEPCNDICKLPKVLQGSTERWEYTFTDGRTYEVIGAPFADSDQVPCMLATFRNVTQRKQLELELIKLDKLKSDLLSNVSHELRSPLTSVKGIISSLLQEDIQWDDETRKMLLIGISEETDRLASLVTNLLNMSKLEAGVWRPEKDRCNLLEMIAETVGRQKWVYKKHVFEAELETDLPEVAADSNQIKQVLLNLLENAAAYSDEGTKITVRARRTDGDVEISVSDQGVGIAPEELEKVFNKFYRGAQRRRRPGGTGLGLAICQSIIAAHGGRIWAESELGHGATFYFILPASQAGETRTEV